MKSYKLKALAIALAAGLISISSAFLIVRTIDINGKGSIMFIVIGLGVTAIFVASLVTILTKMALKDVDKSDINKLAQKRRKCHPTR